MIWLALFHHFESLYLFLPAKDKQTFQKEVYLPCKDSRPDCND